MDFEESFHPLESQAPDAYTEAVEAYCHGILRLHWNERLINKIFGRALQSHAAGRMVVQHFQWQREGAPRPTLALLQRQAGSGGRTLATFFAVLRLAGMVSAEPDVRDRRVRYLVPGPRLLVLGDMGEVGNQGPAFHAEVGDYARQCGIEQLFTLGEQAAGMKGRHFADVEALNAAVLQALAGTQSVLVKGSRFMKMERVVEAITAHAQQKDKGRPDAR